MTNFNRPTLVALYTENKAAQEKVTRNAHKLAWMDATRRMGDVVASCEPQMVRNAKEAAEASKRFADACEGLDVSEIVSIIIEADGVAA